MTPFLSIPMSNAQQEVDKALKIAQNAERLSVLNQLELFDSITEESFDRLTSLASRITNSPVSLVSLIDANRQFFKSQIGLPEPFATLRETPLSHSFCKHVVAENSPLVVEDARDHPFLKDNPAVDELDVIGYLGMPLSTSDGVSLGSFCIIDNAPRVWTEREIKIMKDLSHLVMTEIEIRAQVRARLKAEKELQDHAETLETIVTDRTRELKIANQELHQVDQLKTKFIDDISHELRTPVTNINLYLGLLANGKEGSRPKYEQIIKKQSERLTILLNGILEFSDLQKGVEPRDFEEIALHDLITSAAAPFEKAAADRGLALSIDPGPAQLLVSGNSFRLKQVIDALLKNAVSYTSQGSIRLTTELSTKGKFAVIRVEDSGMGMDDEEMTHCFRRFYRGKRVAQFNITSGSGLGLAQVKDIIAFHKGRVEVESQVDQGTVFTVYLPAL